MTQDCDYCEKPVPDGDLVEVYRNGRFWYLCSCCATEACQGEGRGAITV